MTLVKLKQSLHLDDNDFNDMYLNSLMNSAESSLLPTIGYNNIVRIEDQSKFNMLKDTFVVEYVRGLYFHVDNQKILDALQMQMQSLIEEGDQ